MSGILIGFWLLARFALAVGFNPDSYRDSINGLLDCFAVGWGGGVKKKAVERWVDSLFGNDLVKKLVDG